jgi:hypothetical protein
MPGEGTTFTADQEVSMPSTLTFAPSVLKENTAPLILAVTDLPVLTVLMALTTSLLKEQLNAKSALQGTNAVIRLLLPFLVTVINTSLEATRIASQSLSGSKVTSARLLLLARVNSTPRLDLALENLEVLVRVV